MCCCSSHGIGLYGRQAIADMLRDSRAATKKRFAKYDAEKDKKEGTGPLMPLCLDQMQLSMFST